MPAAEIDIDAECVVRRTNDAALDLFGKQPNYPEGRPVDEFIGEHHYRLLEVCIHHASDGSHLGIPLYESTSSDEISQCFAPLVCVPEWRRENGHSRIAGYRLRQLSTRRTCPELASGPAFAAWIYRQRMATVGESMRALGHELRQPLSAISAYAGATVRLHGANKRADDIPRFLEGIDSQVRAASRIMDDARDAVTQISAHWDDADLNEVVASAVWFIKGRVHDQRIDLRFSLDEPAPRILCQSGYIEQAVVNLLINACDAVSNHAGHDQPIIEIRSTTCDNGGALLTVSDTGAGVTDDALGRIFDWGYTTKPNRLGTGLAAAHLVCAGHGGAIWCENLPSRGGARLGIYLPPKPAPTTSDYSH